MARKPTYEELEQRIAELEVESAEHKGAEEALRESEERFRSIFDTSLGGIFRSTPEGRFIAVNPALASIHGYGSPEEMVSEVTNIGAQLYAHQEDCERYRDLLGQQGMVKDFEVQGRRKDGSRNWISLSTRGIRDAEGNLLYHQGVVVDITERKRAAEVLRESEETAKRAAEVNRSMAEIARIISSTLSIEDIYEQFALEVKKIVDFDRIAIGLISHVQGTYHFAYTSGLEIPDRHKGNTLPLPRIIREIIRTNSVFVLQPEDEKEFVEDYPESLIPFRAGIRSMMVSPLISRDHVVGVLYLASLRSKAYTERDLKLAENVAAQIAGAIASAQLYSQIRRTEEELRVSEQNYRSLYDEAPIGYMELDSLGHIARVNQKELEIFGYTAEEMLSQPMWNFVVGKEAEETIMAKLAGDTPPARGFERAYRRKDGTTVPVLVDDAIKRDGEGRITGIRSTVQDITERKRTEKLLLESEQKFRRLFEDDLTGDYITTEDGIILDCNPAFLRIFGYKSKAAAIGERITGLYLEPSERGSILDKLRAVGKLENYEAIRKRKDGSLITINENIVATFDEGGKLIEVKAYVYDITERKRAEDALRESESRFREMADLLPQGVYETNEQGILTYANRYVFELFGYTGEDFEKGLSVFQMLIPEERDRAGSDLRRVLTGDSSNMDRQYRAMRRDGGSLPVVIYSSAIVHKGTSVGLRGIIVDMTQHEKAENERDKLQAQLLQAQKMESVGRLAGGVAHDFNNMLGIIIGNAEMAALQVDPADPIHQSLQEILKAGHRSADTVRQLLAFARKQTISPKVLDLNDTVSGMLKMLRRLIGEDIDLSWTPGHGLWPVKIDPSQVNQILANLAVNARDAIAGVGKVTIETDNVTFDEAYCAAHEGFLPGQYVLLAVSDNGTGMPKEILKHLFEPFFTTKGVGKGTGLGLSTIFGIVKQNNGFINVYSEPDQGTTFKIYIPGLQPEPIETEIEKRPEKLPRGTETVLMVEDEDAILRIGKAMLEELGYKVLTSTSPGEAIRMVKKKGGEIHLLLTDVVMPEMNGRALADHLKAVCPGLKCLYMSGYTANVIAHHGVLDEGVVFIPKPFSTRELAVKVREVLDKG